jgi:DNA-binding CsgD family transcriptional regulator
MLACRLTAREAEVLYWVVKGKTNRDIGDILGTSPRTVTKHLEHVFEKLGVETRTAAAATGAVAGEGAGAQLKGAATRTGCAVLRTPRAPIRRPRIGIGEPVAHTAPPCHAALPFRPSHPCAWAMARVTSTPRRGDCCRHRAAIQMRGFSARPWVGLRRAATAAPRCAGCLAVLATRRLAPNSPSPGRAAAQPTLEAELRHESLDPSTCVDGQPAGGCAPQRRTRSPAQADPGPCHRCWHATRLPRCAECSQAERRLCVARSHRSGTQRVSPPVRPTAAPPRPSA